MVAAFLVQPHIRLFLPIVVRELLVPGPHFDRLYEAVPRVLHETLTEMVAWILAAPPDDPAVIIRTHALVGSIVVFQIGRTILQRRLEVDGYDDLLVDQVRDQITDIVLKALDLPTTPIDEARP